MLFRDDKKHDKFIENECNRHSIPETPASSPVISSDGPASSANVVSYELALMGCIKEKFSDWCLRGSSIDTLDPFPISSKEDPSIEAQKLDVTLADRPVSFQYYTKSSFLDPQSAYNFPFHTVNYQYVPPEPNVVMHSNGSIPSDNVIKIIYYSHKVDDHDFVIVDPNDLQDMS